MDMYNLEYLKALKEHLASEAVDEDFKFGSASKKEDMLEFLELLMDVAELADEVATRLIFKDSYLSMFTGLKAPGQEPG